MKNLFLFISLFLLPFSAKSQDEVTSKINSHIRSTNNSAPVKRDTLAGVLSMLNTKANAKQDTGTVARNVYYVDRQWVMPVQRQVQNARARVGDPSRPFAEPWTARNMAIVSAGEPTIFIQSGNTFTASDFNSTEHNKTVSIAGTDYVAGIELAYHGITYRFDGATIETPLMSPTFLAAQAANGYATKKSVFRGGKFTDSGSNSSAQSNIHFYVDEGSSSPSRYANRIFGADVGVKTFVAQKMTGVMIGDKWWGASEAGSSSSTRELIRYEIKSVHAHPTGSLVSIPKINNKDVFVGIESANFFRAFLDMGHWSGVANDGTLGGIENSNVSIQIRNIEKTDYVYTADDGGGLINVPNNRNSNITVDVAGFTTTIPKFLWIYGIQQSNNYNYRFQKTIINNATSTEVPFNINLATSTATVEGDFTSNVNADFIQVASGTLKLKGRFVQQAAGKSVINVAAGAKVVCDCELVVTDGVTPTVTGGGTFISINAKLNTPTNSTVSVVGTPQVSSGFNY